MTDASSAGSCQRLSRARHRGRALEHAGNHRRPEVAALGRDSECQGSKLGPRVVAILPNASPFDYLLVNGDGSECVDVRCFGARMEQRTSPAIDAGLG